MLPTRYTRLSIVWLACLVSACAGKQSSGATQELEVLTYPGELVEQSNQQIVVKLPWELQNPTGSAAQVEQIRWSVQVADEAPVTGSTEPNAIAKPGATLLEALTLEIPLNAENMRAHTGKTALRYEATATLSISTATEQEEFEAQWFGDVFPPKPPEVRLEGRAARFGDRALDFTFTVVIANTNPFAISLLGLTYHLTINETEVLAGEMATGQRLSAASEVEFLINRVVGADDLHDLLQQLKGMQQIPYRLTGQLRTTDAVIEVDVGNAVEFGR